MIHQALLIAEFSTLGGAYNFANQLPAENIQLLEVFGAGVALCRGESSQLAFLQSQWESTQGNPNPSRSMKIISGTEKTQLILDTFYSLHHQKIKDSILIFESTSLGQVFEMAQAWVESGILLHDLKASRVSTDPHLLIGTSIGDPSAKLKNASEIQVLYPLSERLHSFFDIEIP